LCFYSNKIKELYRCVSFNKKIKELKSTRY
jgi:hypothetical protein